MVSDDRPWKTQETRWSVRPSVRPSISPLSSYYCSMISRVVLQQLTDRLIDGTGRDGTHQGPRQLNRESESWQQPSTTLSLGGSRTRICCCELPDASVHSSLDGPEHAQSAGSPCLLQGQCRSRDRTAHAGARGEASGVNRHSDKHAPRNIPEAQDAFKVLMIHWILQVARRIAFRCVLHRCGSQDIRR